MIDDCGGVDESSEKSVGFVQEWINTYAFLSREFPSFYFFFISFPFSNFQFPVPLCFALFSPSGRLGARKILSALFGSKGRRLHCKWSYWKWFLKDFQTTKLLMNFKCFSDTCLGWLNIKKFFMHSRRQSFETRSVCENIFHNTLASGAPKIQFFAHTQHTSAKSSKLQSFSKHTLASPAEILIKCRLRHKISQKCERLPGFGVKGELERKEHNDTYPHDPFNEDKHKDFE